MKVCILILAISLTPTVFGSIFSNSFNHNSGSSSSYHNSGGSTYYSSSHGSADPCPAFTDFAYEFQPSSNDTGYPQVAIDNELQILAQTLPIDCLLALTNASAEVSDPSLVHAHDTCPSKRPVLNTFFVRNGTKCWVVKDIQDPINFALCRTSRCLVCDDTFSYNGIQSRCIPEFEYVSVWAFCEDLPVPQIAKERIIIPVSCSCKKIQCNTHPFWWKRK